MNMSFGIWAVGDGLPVPVSRSKVDLEKNLEDWIATDPALLAEGLRVIGRQVSLDGGPLDLLGIDAQGRWVVIELKRERLYRETVAQALDYVACFKALDPNEVRDKLIPKLDAFGDPSELAELIASQLEDEEEREVAVLLVGTGVDPGLERVVSYLGEYELPVSVTTFEVFALASGEQLLVREVIEERVAAPTGNSKQKSVDAIHRQADSNGVGDEFARLVAAAEAAGLNVRPYVRSVMFTPPSHKNRFLMAVSPRSRGRMTISFGPEAFDEFFEDLTSEDVTQALGTKLKGEYQGDQLADKVAAVEDFLERLPAMAAMTPRQELYHAFWAQFQDAFHAKFPGWWGSTTPSSANWMDIPSGFIGTHYGVNFNRGQGFVSFRVELYLGSADAAANEQLFVTLKGKLDADEQPLNIRAEVLEGKKASRFAVYYPQPVSVTDQEAWPEVIGWALDSLGRLSKVIRPLLTEIQGEDPEGGLPNEE